MKKILLFVVLGLALAACSKECDPGAVSVSTSGVKVCNDSGHWETAISGKAAEPSEEAGE